MNILPPFPTFHIVIPPFPTSNFTIPLGITSFTFAIPNVLALPQWIAQIGSAIGTSVFQYVIQWIYWFFQLGGNLWLAGWNYIYSAGSYSVKAIVIIGDDITNTIIGTGYDLSNTLGVAAPVAVALVVLTFIGLIGVIIWGTATVVRFA